MQLTRMTVQLPTDATAASQGANKASQDAKGYIKHFGFINRKDTIGKFFDINSRVDQIIGILRTVPLNPQRLLSV